MPSPGIQRDGTNKWLGINLRADRQDLGLEQLGRSVNADLHKFVGVASLRNGRTSLVSVGSTALRRVSRVNAIRYQVAGTTLYRAGVSIQDYQALSLDSSLLTAVVPFKPLNDTNVWAFVADRAVMQKDNNTVTRRWGIGSPTSISGRDDSTSTYTYVLGVSYIRYDGTTVAHESNAVSVTITE